LLPFIVRLHVDVPEQSPFQPAKKNAFDSGVAVSTTA
jgi:hypothetical protein